MIQLDQPTIFDESLVIGISSVGDGDMKFTSPAVAQNRANFLAQVGIHPSEMSIVQVDYDTDDFLRYTTIEQAGNNPIGDAVATTTPRVALFLPLADCTGAVLYDPYRRVLMVSHLGRHSTEQYGGAKSVEYMSQQHGCSPSDIRVWLSPLPNGADYPLWKFDNRSFSDVLTEQLLSVGIKEENLEVSGIDTVHSPHYFSHSEFLKGNQITDGRHAIVAMMR